LIRRAAHAGATPENTAEKCRNEVTNLPATLSPAQRIEADLLTGVWTEEYVASEAKAPAKSGSNFIALSKHFGLLAKHQTIRGYYSKAVRSIV